MSQWYYAHNGQQKGPVPISELQRLASGGDFDPVKDLVWKEGMDDWKPASTVPELESAFSEKKPAIPGGPPAPMPAATAPHTPASVTAHPTPSAPTGPAPMPSTGLAVGSLVCGILAFLSCFLWCMAIPLAIAAIVTGHLALSKAKHTPERYSGAGMAKVGLILGYLGLVISVIIVVWASTITPEKIEQWDFLDEEQKSQLREAFESQGRFQETEAPPALPGE